ncbi:MAG: RNA polymerase sporulation sigma factor SigH [Clostridia bacterium]|nr:RNA polymerase sporulation sigma factor SigH [Clostridia bacterium]
MKSNNVYYSFDNDLNNLTDEELISVIKQGNQDAIEILLKRYRELVTMKIGKYFIVGAEKEDIFQEGMIGLYKAIKCFDKEKQNSFKAFANLCIERQLITAIKTSNRQKHQPLNSYVSLNTSAFDEDDDTSIIEVLDSNLVEDPLDTITKREFYHYVEDKIDTSLSDFEKQVLHRYANGESYVTIAEKLDAPVKSVDNAIQRIRKKAAKSIMNEEQDML